MLPEQVTPPQRLFALDQNFPENIIRPLQGAFSKEARLVPLRDIDGALPAFKNDWEILLALHHHRETWDGLITTDSSMVHLPRELAVLMQTRLALVVAEASGHDPVKATGLVLSHLSGICKRRVPGRAQLWMLRAADRPGENPWKAFTVIARRQGVGGPRLYLDSRLPVDELAQDPLAEPPAAGA